MNEERNKQENTFTHPSRAMKFNNWRKRVASDQTYPDIPSKFSQEKVQLDSTEVCIYLPIVSQLHEQNTGYPIAVPWEGDFTPSKNRENYE